MSQELDHPKISPMVHPPVLALMFIVLAYLLGRFVPLPFPSAPVWLRDIGLAMTFLGFLLGMGAFLEFRKSRTTLNLHGSTSQVVSSGIYTYSRNPIYLGFLLMVIGLPLYSGLYWGAILTPFYMMTMTRLVIEREEAYLEEKFKSRYTDYKSRVRRWL